MASVKLTKLEMQIMEILWIRGPCSVREVQEAFPKKSRPAYTTVQTVVYRLERKNAARISKKISNANIFEAVITKADAQSRLVDELLNLFGGTTKPVMAHLIQTGKLTMEDIQDAEKTLRELNKKKDKPQ